MLVRFQFLSDLQIAVWLLRPVEGYPQPGFGHLKNNEKMVLPIILKNLGFQICCKTATVNIYINNL